MPNGADFARCEIVAQLECALDHAYARVAQTARAQWELAAIHEPADDIVSVRVTACAKTQRGSAFLRPRARSSRGRTRQDLRPRLAH